MAKQFSQEMPSFAERAVTKEEKTQYLRHFQAAEGNGEAKVKFEEEGIKVHAVDVFSLSQRKQEEVRSSRKKTFHPSARSSRREE